MFLKGHPFLLPAIWNTSLKPTSPAAILYHIKPTIQEGMLYFFCSFKKLPLSPDSLHPSSVDTHTAIKTSWPWLESGKKGGHSRGQWQRQRYKAKGKFGGRAFCCLPPGREMDSSRLSCQAWSPGGIVPDNSETSKIVKQSHISCSVEETSTWAD